MQHDNNKAIDTKELRMKQRKDIKKETVVDPPKAMHCRINILHFIVALLSLCLTGIEFSVTVLKLKPMKVCKIGFMKYVLTDERTFIHRSLMYSDFVLKNFAFSPV